MSLSFFAVSLRSFDGCAVRLYPLASLFFVPAILLFCAADEPTRTSASSSTIAPDTVVYSEAYLEPFFPMSEALTTALIDREHDDSADILSEMTRSQLSGKTAGDQAFVEAWELIRADRSQDAVHLIEVIARAEHVPADYQRLTIAELQIADGQYVQAARDLLEIDDDVPIAARARLAAAAAFHSAGATRQSTEVYQSLANASPPSEGTAPALWALATRSGLGSPGAYPHLRRLWSEFPATSQGRNAENELTQYEGQGAEYTPTNMEIALRGQSLMNTWSFKKAITFLEPHMNRYQAPNSASCLAWYAFGRSLFKRNEVTRASRVLTPAGKQCTEIDPDNGAPALYLAGKSLERKKEWALAAAVYQLIPELYPNHSMADDGYALAGIGWQESGDPERATGMWAQQVQTYPNGDMAAEGFWRLAWSSYRAGDTDAAIQWADSLIETVPIHHDPSHTMAARYWTARWKIYPNVSNPALLNTDVTRVHLGVQGLITLCQDHPSSYYAILAGNRLAEIDTLAFSALNPTLPASPDPGWMIANDLANNQSLVRGIALTRLGLVNEAMTELAGMKSSSMNPTTVAIISEIEARRDGVAAQQRLQHFLANHPPSTYTDNQARVLAAAYPDTYWDLVTEAADGYGFDPRMFHALVREESGFNKDAQSWAGAQGLSQLMPGTARRVARWLNIQATNGMAFDPLTNLRIGSRYFEYLQERFDGNLALAVAGYNAGEGNVDKWLAERGNLPTDEFVESIPFRETRHYVKRVLGTYQLYRLIHQTDPVFDDWTRFNHRSQPEE